MVTCSRSKILTAAIATATSYVKTAEAKSKKNARHGSENSERERLLADMRGGSTLVLDQLQQREPKLGLLCRLLEQELGHRFQTNCYLTPPQGAGFTPHWDNHDVFVLQAYGFKHWKVEKQRRRLPGRSEYMVEEEGRDIRQEDAFSFTLTRET
jgi:ribosomal protein L16 Arg81 hydroxylase